MDETVRIADQLDRSVRGPAWHGPSLMEILSDVTSQEAVQHPVRGGHSIAELVLHIVAWMRAARRGLEGGAASVAAAEDWPPVPDPLDWSALLADLNLASEQLGQRLSTARHAELDRMIPGADQEYPGYVLFHGVVQHNLYHAGQLALLKKTLRTP